MSDQTADSFYQKRIPIYPRSVKGRFRNLKYAVLALAYGVYFLLPWVRWERPNAPNQAVIFDIPDRVFYVFGLTMHPQDMYWLAGILVIAAMLLFMVTGIAGRVFCGYFCFQTLWTDVFTSLEHWIQGERPARIRLDKAPWDAEKIIKKGLTWASWLLVAFATGLTFALYWGNAPTLFYQFFTAQAPFPAYATTFFLTATTFVMAGLAREQVCTYMCPYGRFQSAMFDTDTLIVSYDPVRGENRHKVSKELRDRQQRQAQGVGDCIDCGYCVQVCPTGIDIRNGLQYQCISCALCIDACDTIMDKMGWPRGLIRYTSDKELQGEKTKIIKPKTLGYAVILTAAILSLGWSIANRALYTATVEQIRQPLAVQLADGRIQNSYEIKLNNKTNQAAVVNIYAINLPSGELDLGRLNQIPLRPEQRLRILARVKADPVQLQAGQNHFEMVIVPISGLGDEKPIRRDATFYVP